MNFQNKPTPYTLSDRDEMNWTQKIQFIILLTVGVFLTYGFGFWWFEPSHISHNFSGDWHLFDFILFFALSYVVWHSIVMELFSWYMVASMRRPDAPPPVQKGLRVAYVTAFVPGAEPYEVLEKTLSAMVIVKYPHDTWVLDEGNDPQVIALCDKYGALHYSRKDRQRFNTEDGKFAKKTKGGNYNSWLHHYDRHYDIVAQHDVDFIPEKDFLLRTLGYFNDPDVAFIGTPQIYGNTGESRIACGAAQQTYGFYGPIQKGFYGHGMTLLIGANHIMRMEAYRAIDGYTAHIAEDMLTGMKLYAHEKEWKSVYVPDTLFVGEGPTTWSAYFGQQMRWSYGCMDIVFRHAPTLFSKMTIRRIINYVLLQQFYFSGVAQAAGVMLLTLYFLFGITSGNLQLLPIFLLYLPLLIFQQIFQLWIQQFNIEPKTERGFYFTGKIMFIAAWPIFFLAFIGVLRKKRLSYVVTPKGNSEEKVYEPKLFVPHLILGSITLCDILIGFYIHHSAPQILFWAALNTVCMYGLFFSQALPAAIAYLKKTPLSLPEEDLELYGPQYLR